ncbi:MULTISPECIES: hypothetical protein [Amniculibacterium]|jgi:hypothetical protein|uniref:hypothetical protein n=1 Tax=Amniculibacterium TaxID=2715289 RepID=UPI000F5949A1|nr:MULTISPECIES: hypothetical protein [Amniculibacterium]
MKYILELILSTIIIFFVWNMLKRIFSNYFYTSISKKFQAQQNPYTQSQNKNKPKEEKIKWDAETVDYEEVEQKK